MAQETVIHRTDAELGTGQPVAPVPADLAVDGIDKLPKVFVAYSVAEWGACFTGILAGPPTAGLRWVWNREGAGEPGGVTIEGAPEAVGELRRCIVTATQ